jgi:RimJ/RimL family protein N-acetyltransferase
MNTEYVFESERLGFRRWSESDKTLFAVMNSDPEVMRYFPSTLSREESDQFLDRIEEHFEDYGYGLWAVEKKSDREFIGFYRFFHSYIYSGVYSLCRNWVAYSSRFLEARLCV